LLIAFALTVLTALLFFKKRSSAPLTWVVLTWVSVVWGNGILIWGVTIGLDHETNPARAAGGAVRDVVVAMAWTAYMFSSRRVRATFVERWRPAPPAVAPGQEPPGPPGAPS